MTDASYDQLTIESTRKAFNIAEKIIFLEAFEK